MNDSKYIGLDVHQATISVAVLDSAGKLVMEAVLETKAATILQFIHGLRGTLRVTLEEGTCAAWLHDVLKPHVAHVLVCDPRKNALIKAGNKSDRIDARKLADLCTWTSSIRFFTVKQETERSRNWHAANFRPSIACVNDHICSIERKAHKWPQHYVYPY